MTISKLIAACGMCVAFGTASAQTEQPTRQPTTPTTTPNTPSTPGTTGSWASADDTRALLKKLEGNWKVDVSVNTSLWNPHLFKDVNDKNPSNISDAPRDRSTTTRDSDGKPVDRNNDRTNTNDRANDRTNMDKDRMATGEGMKTFSGYTRNELILGDVLQQTTYMPDLDSRMGTMGKHVDGKDMDRKNTDDRNADGTPRNKDGDKYNDKSTTRSDGRTDAHMKGDGKFKGVSLLSFDQDSKTYSMVFLSNGEDQMHLKNGTYTTSGNQIVFHGSDHGHGGSKVHGVNTGSGGTSSTTSTSQPNSQPTNTPPDNAPRPGNSNNNDRTSDRNPGNPNNPSINPDSRSIQPSTGAGMNDSHAWKKTMSGCQVVIDFISPDEHRVTMYATEGPLVSSPTAPGNPGRLDSTPPDNASGINRTDPASNDPKLAMTAGKVVYRAVFRRATGDEIARTREATRLTDATSSDNR